MSMRPEEAREGGERVVVGELEVISGDDMLEAVREAIEDGVEMARSVTSPLS